MGIFACCGMQGFLYELSQSSSITNLIDFVQFFIYGFLWVEIPNVYS